MSQTSFSARPASWLAGGLLLLSAAGSAEAAQKTYQYYRFTVVKVRDGGTATATQMSELALKLAGTNLITPTTTVTATTSTLTAAEGYGKLRDGILTNKYYSATKPAVTYNFGTPTTIDSYAYATGNDFDGRDPVSWTLEGSADNTTWDKLDIVNDAVITNTRNVWAQDFIIPEFLPPTIPTFAATASVVSNGGTTDLSWTTAGNPTSLTFNPGALDVTGTTTKSGLAPAANADTVYSLTATNAAGSNTATRTIRAVAGGSRSFQYIRFTPLAVGSGNAVQLADIRFYGTDTVDVGGVPTPTSVERVPTQARLGTAAWTETAVEGPNKLRDGNSATKWYNAAYATANVTFDLGAVKSFDKYTMTTANDSPERTPIRWKLEGSNDLTTWSRIEDLSTFDVSMSSIPFTVMPFPFPGDSLPPVIGTFTADAAKIVAGDPVTFNWTTTDAATVTITPDVNAVVANGSITVTPTTGGVYTLSAKSTAGFTVTKTVTVTVLPTASALPNYPTFDTENGELSLTGSTTILNDFANIPAPGNQKRLRLTPNNTGRNGGAWFPRRVDFSQGFDTTFSFMLTKPDLPAADGFSFVIQNDTNGNAATGNGENGTTNASFAIGLDTYYNADALPADGSAANLKVFEGSTSTATNRTAKVSINLANVPGVTGINGTGTAASLTTTAAVAVPHTVRAKYDAGLLNVWFDGLQVVTDLPISLTLSLNASNKGWVGFVGRTGGYSVTDDITSWVLTTGTPPVVLNPLVVTSYSLNTTAGTGTITWSSNAGTVYRITGSSNLLTFGDILVDNQAATGSSTTANFTFTPGTSGFFRVEEKPQ